MGGPQAMGNTVFLALWPGTNGDCSFCRQASGTPRDSLSSYTMGLEDYRLR
jgi:hypothetical protein